MERKRVRIGVKEGQGPPPGYQWNAWKIDLADDEAADLLDAEQYEHMAGLVQELARQDDPTHSPTVSVRKMTPEQFYEIRDKGGVLNRLNVRLFFGVDKGERAIVVLGCMIASLTSHMQQHRSYATTRSAIIGHVVFTVNCPMR